MIFFVVGGSARTRVVHVSSSQVLVVSASSALASSRLGPGSVQGSLRGIWFEVRASANVRDRTDRVLEWFC